MGLDRHKGFHRYHRVLSHASWSSVKASRVLLGLLVEMFVPEGDPLVVGIDEILERRWGKKISAKGVYRDPVRSTQDNFVKSSGLRWVCVMLLVEIPWAARSGAPTPPRGPIRCVSRELPPYHTRGSRLRHWLSPTRRHPRKIGRASWPLPQIVMSLVGLAKGSRRLRSGLSQGGHERLFCVPLASDFYEKAHLVKADLTMFACRRSRLRQCPGG